jgi:hypothetical protein
MSALSSQEMLHKVVWIRGLPPVDFWIRREGMIGDFIKRNKLVPTDMSGFEYMGMGATTEVTQKKATLPIRRPPFPGGMLGPHLHFKGDVYVLDEKQWQVFSGVVVKDLGTKLAKMAALPFDQLRDTAEHIDKIG